MTTRKPTSRSRISKAERARLVASITVDVASLVEQNRYRALETVMEATGYLSNRTMISSAQLGDAISALAGVLEARFLASTARAAAFERVFERTNEQWRAGRSMKLRPGRWELACAAADAAVGPCEEINAVEQVQEVRS